MSLFVRYCLPFIHSIHQPILHSFIHSLTQSLTQAINQSINQSASPPSGHSSYQPTYTYTFSSLKLANYCSELATIKYSISKPKTVTSIKIIHHIDMKKASRFYKAESTRIGLYVRRNIARCVFSSLK